MTFPVPAPAQPGLVRRETRTVRVGFIPLVDAAVLFAAEEMGFARDEGLTLDLRREVSWSNIRDRLAFRQFDAAHLLGAMAVAAQIGIGTNPFPIVAPMALGRGGNAITLSSALAEAMDGVDPGDVRGPAALLAARRLERIVRERQGRGLAPLVFGVVYPFSSHNYEFRFWLACGGIDPDRDVRMTVVPPPMTADALRAGAIDGFCVNAPWNVEAVRAGAGRIVAVKADIWPSAPEKVLGVRPDWAEANRETLHALIRAGARAARWCDDPANRAELAAIVASRPYLDTDGERIRALLEGRLNVGPGDAVRDLPDYLVFHRGGAQRPRRAEALWTFGQMVRWGQAALTPAAIEAAADAFRPDIFDTAVRGVAEAAADDGSGDDGASERLLDGRLFDPADIAGYLAGFDIPAAKARRDDAFDD